MFSPLSNNLADITVIFVCGVVTLILLLFIVVFDVHDATNFVLIHLVRLVKSFEKCDPLEHLIAG